MGTDLPSPAGPSRAGQPFPGYRIIDKIGAGGMGVVYKAEDLKLHRTVALKLLPHELHAPERARELFLREARSASALDHPNIGTIHAIEEAADGSLFIVMAYYDGDTLAAKIRRAPLPPAQAVDIAIQMARGLAEAHAHNIVHRDIKPGNVIVTRQGLAKIVDFGLARVMESSDSTASVTVSGTAAYMSPEQAQGRALDHRTDLWSLGVALYEMLTGRLPFEGDSVPARLYSIVHAAPAAMGGAPLQLQAIVYRALAKDPAERYPTAGQMLEDLESTGYGRGPLPTTTLPPEDLERYRASASRPAADSRSQHSFAWKWIALFTVTLLLAASAIGLFAFRDRAFPGLFTPAAKHIAVLPLSTIGGDAPNTAIADGLMESLTSKLSNLDVGPQSLWVVPASEVRRLKINDAAAARREFGATLVVNGSLERHENTVRLIVNLIDTKNMRQIGSAELDDRTGDYAALQDSAVTRLAGLMKVPLTREMIGSAGGSVKPAAYESYLKGLGLLQRYDKPGNLDQAESALESATATDPQFALGFAGLGEALLLKYQTDQNPRWLDQAGAACRRAAELNEQLPPVHVILGRVHNAQGHVDLALEEFQRALDLNPRSAEALSGMGRVYETQGRLPQAEETYRRATVLRPDYWDGYNTLGRFYLRTGRSADAAAQFQKVIDLTPDNAPGYLNLGAALSNARKTPEAIQALQRSLRIAPSYAAYTNLGNIYYRQDQWQEAARNYEEAVKLNDKDFRPWLNLAAAYRGLRQPDRAALASARGLPLLEAIAKSRPQDATLQSALGLEYAHAGQREKAVARLEAAAAMAPRDASILERVGEGYETLGDRSRAVAWINRALAKGYSLDTLKRDPDMRGILADPRFKPPSK